MNLDKLNNMQKEAVLTTEGPVLILAGAGSGKTTVLVNRISYILEQNLTNSYGILAITFTNKAANEMKTRVENVIGDKANGMWISTFHSACAKILRSYIERLGFSRNFVIYDSDDSKTVIKDCLKELNLDDKVFNPRSVASQISKAKDELISCEQYENYNQNDYRLSKIASVYTLYQDKLKKNNALDFDDMVFFAVKLLKENPDILSVYHNKFKYIMVDEYQDTSTAQYMLISLLASGNQNICVVGDDDQSIYKFRGANIRNILDFEKDFKNAKIIKLEQNYRSTKCILNAANSVIHNNGERKDKALWTDNAEGEKIKIYTASTEHDEARFVATEIEKKVKEGASYSDFAILYRTNAQSRVIEDSFMRNIIPYRVLSGLRFYDRKEIKDIIAYLRVILNSDDDVSLERIINEPKRGIGKTTMDKAAGLARMNNKSVYQIIKNCEDYPEMFRNNGKFSQFCSMIEELKEYKDKASVVELINKLLNVSGYMTALELENTVESQARIENIKEFITVAQEFEKSEEDKSFEAFIENVTLVSGIDMYDEDEDYVVMMTIHSSKGLEFKNVFLIGVEEGIFPSLKNMSESQDLEDLEEERRLCYVAITRAKEDLFISSADQRTIFGRTTYQNPSRFIKEIRKDLVEAVGVKKFNIGKTINTAKNTVRSISEMKPISITPKIDKNVLCDFSQGDIVYHKKFGRGIVLSAKAYGKDTLVEVNFDSVGTKQLMAVFAKLSKTQE